VYLTITIGIGGGVGYAIGAYKGRALAGWAAGAALFFVGWAVMAALPTTEAELAARRGARARRTPAQQLQRRRVMAAVSVALGFVAAWLLIATVVAIVG